MPDLLAGSLIQAADWPESAYDSDGTMILNVSTTSYIPGTPVVSINFTAPTSGRVLLIVGLAAGDNTGANRVQYAPQVFQGEDELGAIVLSPDSGNRGVVTASTSTNYAWWPRITLLEGLAPGLGYFARGMYKVDGGANCDITYRDIGVSPAP